jgi:hypothetical protein
MLEKTGAVTLTEEELIQIRSGVLPQRIEQTWGLSLSELSSIISSGNYQTTGVNSPDLINKTN